jgi:hypothetical protein
MWTRARASDTGCAAPRRAGGSATDGPVAGGVTSTKRRSPRTASSRSCPPNRPRVGAQGWLLPYARARRWVGDGQSLRVNGEVALLAGERRGIPTTLPGSARCTGSRSLSSTPRRRASPRATPTRRVGSASPPRGSAGDRVRGPRARRAGPGPARRLLPGGRRRALTLAGSSVSRGPGSTLGLGTMSARPRAAGAKTPWSCVRLRRGCGTMATRRARSWCGVSTMPVVPSSQPRLNFRNSVPSACRVSLSCDSGGRWT